VTADAATPDAYRAVVLDAQIRWSMAPLRACYATRLQSQASFAGRVSFKLEPGASGRAVLSGLSPSEGDEGLAAVAGCVARVAADWRLTPAPGALSTTATVELDFQAR
jgi:hypothetical protein